MYYLLRFIAAIIDGIILSIIAWLLRFIVPDDTGLVSTLISLGLGIIYFGVLEGSSMQASLGKRILGLMVTDTSGNPPGYAKAFIRAAVFYVLLALFVIPGIIDLLFIFFNPRKQALHDMVAGCMVTKR